MKVSEIFLSIEGEGIRTGYPAIFIRLYGCNLRCVYCDSMYSVDEGDFTEMSLGEIMNEVQKYGVKRITLTGGEPLIHKDVYTLLSILSGEGYEVNIETNGSVDLSTLANLSLDNTIITMDWKSISSGESDKMLSKNLENLSDKDVLKFVVGSTEDLDQMKDVIENRATPLKCQIFVSPIFGDIEPSTIVDYILEHDLETCRVQLQLHKFIWDPNKRGV